MPAHRKDLNILDLTGRLQHDKKRHEGRTETPDSDALTAAAPPIRLITFEEAWAYIVQMAPEGVLRKRDEALVMEAARLYMTMQNWIALGRLEEKALCHVDNNTHKQFLTVLAKLGLTPTDARNVSAPTKKPDNGEFD